MSLPTPREFRFLRKKAGLTQKQLAERAGFSQPLIARIEKGDIDTKIGTARKILDVIRSAEAPKKSLELKDYMISPVIYCKETDPIRKVVLIMEENNISQMPVMGESRSVGSVTDTQLVKVLSRKDGRSANKKISSVMARPFPEIELSAPIDRAISLLTKNPAILVRNEGNIVGIITKADVLRFMV